LTIALKRVYDTPETGDGFRILVERLWPRGLSKEKARIDLWLREAGASPQLRKWFGHDPMKWEPFCRRYFAELRDKPLVVGQLQDIVRSRKKVTFVFAARDEEHNNAVALKEFMEKRQLQEPAIRSG
jgi:uncharacterized protein YeaO (DUF488 family)